MPIELDAVTPDRTQPARADVVIIGGGIAGVATALYLAQRGVKAVVCEKGVIAGEQSGRNWGWCRTMGRDPLELPLAVESLRLWRELNAQVDAETGFRQCGTLYICPDEAAFKTREAWLPYAKQHGIDSRLLREGEVNEVLEDSIQRWYGALHTPSDGVAEPSMAVPAMARAAQRSGAIILTQCAVRGLERSGGRVIGVFTERGRISCERVVLAGGVWSGLFCRNHGVRLPLLKVAATVLRTAAVDQGPSTAAWGPGLSLRKRLDGGYTVSSGQVIADLIPDSFRYFRDFLPLLRAEWRDLSMRFGRPFVEEWRLTRPWGSDEPSPFEMLRTLDPDPAPAAIARARSNLERAFPTFRGIATSASWAGMIDATPDLVPVISEVDTLPGLVISSGFSGHGFGIGPAAGRLTADLVMGTTPIVDPSPFRFSRFTDGSKLRPFAGF